jgi:NTP pyrophosphatase (non-canonical NTP hydrolase)
MSEYQRNGQQVVFYDQIDIEDHVITHIADAGDPEKADFLVQASNSFRTVNGYIDEARQTLSPAWHGDKVNRHIFMDTLLDGINAANDLDRIKKAIFYGRGDTLLEGGELITEDFVVEQLGDGNADPRNIVHGIIGAFTEAGELLEALYSALTEGGGFDPINMREEIGDLFWYVAILLYEASRDGDGYTFEECMRVNIRKLRARFPNRFTEFDANNRNLPAERAILER